MSKRQSKSKLTKRIIITILAVVIMYVILGFLPRTWCQKLVPGSGYGTQTRFDKHYMIQVEQGKKYSIEIHASTTYDQRPNIQLYRNAFRISGTRTEGYHSGSEEMFFTAHKNGYYYVKIHFPAAGYYSIFFSGVSTYLSSDNILEDFMNWWNLLLILSPMILGGTIVYLTYSKNKKNLSSHEIEGIEKTKKVIEKIKFMKCTSCGQKLPKGIGFCKYCGFTFSSPEIPERK